MKSADGNCLNIVVPMAGRGSRFSQAGFVKPKPLILLGGIPIIHWVINNIRPSRPHRFIFICLKEHLVANPELFELINRLCPDCVIVEVNQVTEGAACTVLLARKYIDNDDPLMIANSDQYVEVKIDDYLSATDDSSVSGLIMTFWADHAKWSYCRLGASGNVTEVVEKKVISNEATVGIYNFRSGRDYVWAAEEMIRRNLRVNNEFYVAPTYNLLIEQGYKIVVRQTGREYSGMYGLGTPEDFEFFQTSAQFRRDCPKGFCSPLFQQRNRLERRTQFLFRFLQTNNQAGVDALLAPDVNCYFAAKKTNDKGYARKWLFESVAPLVRANALIPNVIVDGNITAVEINDMNNDYMRLQAVIVLIWDDNYIKEVRLYADIGDQHIVKTELLMKTDFYVRGL